MTLAKIYNISGDTVGRISIFFISILVVSSAVAKTRWITTEEVPTIAIPGLDGQRTATLQWDASDHPDVVGYRIYWGFVSKRYFDSVDVSNLTQVRLLGLESRRSYYFAVCSVDAEGKQSAFSNEVSLLQGPVTGIEEQTWGLYR